MDGSKEIHRVHFDLNKDASQKDNNIIVEKKDLNFEVHMGFLQLNHKYKINFTISRHLCQSSVNNKTIPVHLTTVSPYIKLISGTVLQDSLHFQLELLAHKEKLMIEEFTFRLDNDVFTVKLYARVLGKNKGTPLLKNEIHLIEAPVDSDSSD